MPARNNTSTRHRLVSAAAARHDHELPEQTRCPKVKGTAELREVLNTRGVQTWDPPADILYRQSRVGGMVLESKYLLTKHKLGIEHLLCGKFQQFGEACSKSEQGQLKC